MRKGWMSGGSFYDDTNEPLTPEGREALRVCSESHAHGCPCRFGGDIELAEIVVEDHDGYLVVADRGF